ncbi:Glycosyl transferases group 1 [anaerobic digester metagenome]|nr:glycosyltransferase family 4 protein [Lentimicrobiaceae bacterium]
MKTTLSNKNKERPVICFPHAPGTGGPGSFQNRFEKELGLRGWKIEYKGKSTKADIIFIVGGTKSLLWLFRMKFMGKPVIYRLDGISWLHKKKKVGLKKFLLAEYRNWNNKLIHAFIADKIIYQSYFVKMWWDSEGWRKKKKSAIIYNGAPITDGFKKDSVLNPPNRLVVLEGTIDYSPYAIRLLNDLANLLPATIQLELYGGFEDLRHKAMLSTAVNYKGIIPHDEVNKVLINSVYLSLDINPACPNTVIEALSCGTPVVAFDTGSLKELVQQDAGVIVPYGSDPWQLEYPDVDSLIKAILKVNQHYDYYSKNAIMVAENMFSLSGMTNDYLAEINKLIAFKNH